METRDQINALESRQLELQAAMSKSDAHAAKCTKLGLSFAETYPGDLVEYEAAREEYNTNEATLDELYRRLAQEEAEQAAPAEPVEE